MHITNLDFQYPEELVATEPLRPSRVMIQRAHGKNEFYEANIKKVLDLFLPGDVLVINNTRVEPRRVFARTESGEDFEILFIDRVKSDLHWKVLAPFSRLKKNEKVLLPGQIEFMLVQNGLPQEILVSKALTKEYFDDFGDVPLPPYIQKSRSERHSRQQDKKWYQTEWASVSGSSASPTASLHFTQEDIDNLKLKGVKVVEVTLHVGLGTYQPVQAHDISQHKMHSEEIEVSHNSWQVIQNAKTRGGRIWALGTTALRTIESISLFTENNSNWGDIQISVDGAGNFRGRTSLYIRPGYQFRITDILMTNFHQPKTTLLALVMTFAQLECVKNGYDWAIQNKMRLFSYGDLSVWPRSGIDL